MIRSILIGLAGALSLGAQSYQIDSAHSSASFTVKHMMVTNVSGRFSNVKGSVAYDAKDLAKSSIDATIDIGTVNTNQEKRDAHLKSPDFFDLSNHPAMTFKSAKFYQAGGETKVDGQLTLHGVTKPVTLTLSEISPEVKSASGTLVRGATATAKLKRSDFGLTWNKTIESGGVVVSDEVSVTIEIEMFRKPA